jgi:hypothetical protein
VLDEFIARNDANHATTDISALVHPNGMGEVFKYLANYSLEKKEDDRKMFCTFINTLNDTSAGELFSKAQALRGVLLFLHDLDEIAIDVPRAETYFAAILANMVQQKLIDLTFLGSVPDDSNFTISARSGQGLLSNIYKF